MAPRKNVKINQNFSTICNRKLTFDEVSSVIGVQAGLCLVWLRHGLVRMYPPHESSRGHQDVGIPPSFCQAWRRMANWSSLLPVDIWPRGRGPPYPHLLPLKRRGLQCEAINRKEKGKEQFMKSIYSSLVALVVFVVFASLGLLTLGRHGRIKSAGRTDFRC